MFSYAMMILCLRILKVLKILPIILGVMYYIYTKDLVHPVFYVCKSSGNVNKMVKNLTYTDTNRSAIMADMFWTRKLSEVKFMDMNGLFRPYQSINHIIGEPYMSTKGSLTYILREWKEKHGLDYDDSDEFYPSSYRLYDREDLVQFLKLYESVFPPTDIDEGIPKDEDVVEDQQDVQEEEEEEGVQEEGDTQEEEEIVCNEDDVCHTKKSVLIPNFTWMLKPVGLSGGKGIRILNQNELEMLVEVIREFFREAENFTTASQVRKLHEVFDLNTTKTQKFIIQKYIHNPMLVNGRKFSIRTYFLVASLNPLRVLLYREGRTATASDQYKFDEETIRQNQMHLTNVHQQNTADRDYNEIEMWNLEMLNDYIKENMKVDTWLEDFLDRVSEITGHVVRAWIPHVDTTKTGLFYGHYGMDIILDEDLNVIMTEIQKGCGMKITNPTKRAMMVPMMDELFEIIYEIQCAVKEGRELTELRTRKKWQWVINDAVTG